ncbi:hypothetical protein Pcinc_039120, partial [Petrolisthes cinctipes]
MLARQDVWIVQQGDGGDLRPLPPVPSRPAEQRDGNGKETVKLVGMINEEPDTTEDTNGTG